LNLNINYFIIITTLFVVSSQSNHGPAVNTVQLAVVQVKFDGNQLTHESINWFQSILVLSTAQANDAAVRITQISSL
jgi:hypothetical protein